MSLRVEKPSDKNVFKQIFENHWSEFKNKYPSYDSPQYNEAVEKMLGCGELSSGYSEYTCMDCGHSHKVCFSCKSGFCLSCSVGYADGVVNQVSKMLHPGVIYRHMILTIPEQLRELFYQNRHSGQLLSDFMRVGYECLEEGISYLRKQKLKIGCVVVIHTHGRSGQYKPHLHVIMTDGGINELGNWIALGYIKFSLLRRKWQYKLLNWVKSFFGTSVRDLVDCLWKKYPKGFVMNVTQGNAPQSSRGLARYLAKYVASPPIAIKRIMDYDGTHVKYWYNSHETKSREVEQVDVMTFIGRMVQHIRVKGFQRIRYYGLLATKTFKKWKEVVVEGVRKLGKVIQGAYWVVATKSYRQRYQQTTNTDPLMCPQCNMEMALSRVWHPKYGVIYDLNETLPIVQQEYQKRKNRHDQEKLVVPPIQMVLPGLQNLLSMRTYF